ncbi:MAG: alpha/beta hydrolase, partial [Alphaproteobacteria bacterium]
MLMRTASFTSIPADRAEAFQVETAPGTTLMAYRIGRGREQGPAILFGHANGLAAGSYLPMLELLGDRAQVFAFDSRGHGGSSVPTVDLPRAYARDVLIADLTAVIKAVRARIGEAPLYYAAHSKCAVEALHLGVSFGRQPWRAATLFEPPLLPPRGHPLREEIGDAPPPIIEMSRRRRARWPGPEALARSLAKRPVFARCLPEMLAAHCR